jgi:hypothetical protein
VGTVKRAGTTVDLNGPNRPGGTTAATGPNRGRHLNRQHPSGGAEAFGLGRVLVGEVAGVMLLFPLAALALLRTAREEPRDVVEAARQAQTRQRS